MTQQPAVERRHPPDALMRLVNPVIRRAARHGRAGQVLLVLHFTGRRTGQQYDVPVGARDIDGDLCVFTSSRWRHNFADERVIEVTRGGLRERKRAQLLDDPDHVAELLVGLVREHGISWARRNLGVRINVGRTPTVTEMRAMVVRSGFAVLRLSRP